MTHTLGYINLCYKLRYVHFNFKGFINSEIMNEDNETAIRAAQLIFTIS
jgi:hypothetical protein